ncbi:hypothetical protein Rctr71_044 [Virus Rctr71]|nr:hypothetical protein Rctr71_044 [Virus Rctr71]
MPRPKGAKNKNPSVKTCCPHCKRPIDNRSLPRHARTCMMNPEVATAARETVRKLSPDGFLCKPGDYENEVKDQGGSEASGLPYRPSTQKFLGTDRWDEKVAAWAGLSMPMDRMNATKAEMIRLSQELYEGKYGPSMSDWQMYAEGEVHADSFLRARWGKWEKVLAHFGLQAASASYYYQARKERQDQAEAEQLELMESEAHEFELRKKEKMNWPIRFIERVKVYWDWNIHMYRVTKVWEVA